jgi:hypothetical protein
MVDDTHRTLAAEAGLPPEALSKEVLKLKVDDLFQEIENIKRRLARLEGQLGLKGTSERVGAAPHPGAVSNPDPVKAP